VMFTMNLRKWLSGHSIKLLAIRDEPNAIAGGVAIGIFFGFTPLFGLKTILSLLLAWLFRCNLLAAAIAVTLHDLVLPFMPVVFRWEYDVGYWLLSNPHRLPTSIRHLRWNPEAWRTWTTFVTVGVPLLVGSVVCAAPVAVATYFVTFRLVKRRQLKRQPLQPDPSQTGEYGE
jgi:uncharacterized protein (DUF2062 family)